MDSNTMKPECMQDSPVRNPGKSLSVKSANLFFLISFLVFLIISVIPMPGVPMSWQSLFSYIPILVIGLLFCRKDGIGPGAAFRFRGAKPLTFLLGAAVVVTVQPIMQLIAQLTNIILPNAMGAIRSEIENSSFLVNVVGFILIPAFFEELLCRGSAFNSYQRTGKLRTAVLLSSLLFGLFHMNAGQFFYAAAMGIVMALLFMLSDSIWPGVLFHFLNNGIQIVMSAQAGIYGDVIIKKAFLPFTAWGLDSPAQTVITVAGSAAGLMLTFLCLRGIAKAEGSTDKLKAFVKGGGGEGNVITIPLIISLVLMTAATVFVMIGTGMQASGTP